MQQKKRWTPVEDRTLGNLQFPFRMAAGRGSGYPAKQFSAPPAGCYIASCRERKDKRAVVQALHTQPVLTFPTTLPGGVGNDHLLSMAGRPDPGRFDVPKRLHRQWEMDARLSAKPQKLFFKESWRRSSDVDTKTHKDQLE